MTRLLLYIKHRIPSVWNLIEWLNAALFRLLHGTTLADEALRSCNEFHLAGYKFRLVRIGDLSALHTMLKRQSEERLRHFRPHGFEFADLRRIYANKSFLMFCVCHDEKVVGYFFLRCFWNSRSFVGRLIDEPHERRGIGRVMNNIMYHTAWRSGFRCHTTISKNNEMVMRSHANNPSVKVLGELANGYLFIEFVPQSGESQLTFTNAVLKRSFDIVVSGLGLVLVFWIIAAAWLIASVDTSENGFFRQYRVGRFGRLFKTNKIRTMRSNGHTTTTVTTSNDPRITRIGKFWRKTKIDELPQLINVLLGQMSFVGPRPDVPGFADSLRGEDRIVLAIRPGITGPATLKYRNEEELLARLEEPESYNRDVIFPDKVRLNREYITKWSFWGDIRYIVKTFCG